MGSSTATYTFRQCLPRCRISAEFYEIRAGERACLSSDILNVFFLEFDFYMAWGQLQYGPLLSPAPFLPTFYFCIAFLGYQWILGILSPFSAGLCIAYSATPDLLVVNRRFHPSASLVRKYMTFAFHHCRL